VRYDIVINPKMSFGTGHHETTTGCLEAIDRALKRKRYRSMLDVGTGTGRMLQLLGRDVERAVGFDSSHSMLAVARANLERAEIRGIDLRQGDVYSPPFANDSFDLIVIHQVLHFLDDPARAVREAARLLSPGGRLLIVDFAPHSLEFLRADHAHLRLGFRAETVEAWLEQAGLEVPTIRTIAPPSIDGGHAPEDEGLTVSLWLARDRRDPLIQTRARQQSTQLPRSSVSSR
jgi:ArsR family transcriptional regulator